MKMFKISVENVIVLYALIVVAFVLVTVMNFASYQIVEKLGDDYATLDLAVKSFKETFQKTNLAFSNMVNGKGNKNADFLKDVTNYLEESKKKADILSRIQPRLRQLTDILNKYQTIVENTRISLEPSEQEKKLNQKNVTAAAKCLTSAYGVLNSSEDERNSLLKNQMGFVRFIYAVLLVGNLIAFGAIVFVTFLNDRAFKKKEHNLNAANANFMAVMQGLDSILITIDSDGKVITWNSNAVRYFDVEANDVLGENIYKKLPVFQQFKDFFTQVCCSRSRHYRYHDQLHVNRGPMRVVDILCVPIIPKGSSTRNNVHLLVKMDDVTSFATEEQHHMRERAVQLVATGMENVLRDAGNMNDQAVSVIDELNTIAANNGIGDTVTAYTNYLSDLLMRISMIPQRYSATLQSGTFNKIQIDLNEMIMYVLRICMKIYPSNINLEVSLNETKSWVLADPMQLIRALFCLMNNASESITEMRNNETDKGGIVSISIEKIAGEKIVCDRIMRFRHAVKEPPYWVIMISDTGTGIKPEELSKIYDPFYTTKNTELHKGLGLSIVVNTINELGGYVDVNSTPGHGSVFKIYLPEMEGIDSNETSATADLKADEPDIVRGNGGILFVNDDVFMQKITSGLLRSLGYSIVVADNGFDATDIYARDLQSEKPSIQTILINTSPTYYTDVEIVKNIKSMNPDARIVVMVSSKSDPKVSELETVGVTDFIKKPYAVPELSQILAKQLQEYTDSKELHG